MCVFILLYMYIVICVQYIYIYLYAEMTNSWYAPGILDVRVYFAMVQLCWAGNSRTLQHRIDQLQKEIIQCDRCVWGLGMRVEGLGSDQYDIRKHMNHMKILIISRGCETVQDFQDLLPLLLAAHLKGCTCSHWFQATIRSISSLVVRRPKSKHSGCPGQVLGGWVQKVASPDSECWDGQGKGTPCPC